MSATLTTPKTTSGGEIITHLINSTDGTGLHFDGAAGNIDIVTPPDLGTKFSFELIIQADSWPASGSYIYIVDFGNGGRFVLGNPNTGKFSIRSVTGDWISFGSAVLDDLKVHHIVVTVDGTSAIAYDNGNQIGTATITSPNIDSCTDARIGSDYVGTASFFDGNVFRARLWNKTLSQAEVTASYENATVPFSDQYGSQTSLVDPAASVFTSGTYHWAPSGSNTVANVSNTLAITYTGGSPSATGAKTYLRDADSLTSNLTVGKKYRLTTDAKYAGGSSGVRLLVNDGASSIYSSALTTSLVNYTIEFTAQSAAGGYFQLDSMGASNVVTIDNWYVREIGCVADYDLAFANPSPSPNGQSLMVRDRASAADGTSSTAGVVQVTPIEQLNSKSARIGTTAATPADGELLVSGDASIGGSGTGRLSVVSDSDTSGAPSAFDSKYFTVGKAGASGASSGAVFISYNQTDDKGYIGALSPTTAWRDLVVNQSLTIDSAGNVGIGVTPGTKLHVLSGTDNNLAADISEVRVIGSDKAITGEQANLVVQTNDDFAINKGGSIGLGGRYATASTNGANFAQISGRKENATTANFAGYLAFSTSDSASDIHERLRIDSAGNVGIGVTPVNNLSVLTTGDAADDAAQSTFALMLQKSDDTENLEVGLGFRASTALGADKVPGAAITFERTGAKSIGSLHFKTAGAEDNCDTRLTISSSGTVTIPGAIYSTAVTSGAAGSIEVVSTDPSLRLTATGSATDKKTVDIRCADNLMYIRSWNDAESVATTRMKIDLGTGLATFANGIAVTTGGIQFPATQSASADANTLDDYEEGSWTPTYTPHTNAFTSITYVGATPGRYTKIGNMVTVWGYIGTGGITVGTASGSVYLSGLPFVQATVGADKWGTNNVTHIQLSSGENAFRLFYRTSITANETAVNVTDMSTGGDANYTKFVFSYRV